ncbi:Pentatricopeptide repeat [Dillenia turbinata]|uniref:Pentatricopeptide repeat n=1 Tax=Dillenia turbinata TaxID=194707 RepID=A0AAN8VPJ8_9MAGN
MRCMPLPFLNWVRVVCASVLTIIRPTPIPPGILPFSFKLSSSLADTAITSYESLPLLTWQNLLSVLHKQQTSRRLFQQLHSQSLIAGFASTDSLLLWNALLCHYALGIFPEDALYLYKFASIPYCLPFAPNGFTYNFLLKACASLQHMFEGIQFHAVKDGFDSHGYVQTDLLNMYAGHRCTRKACCIESAFNFFDEIPSESRTLVSRTTIISSFAMHGMAEEAIENFERMEKECFRPNSVSFSSIFKCFAGLKIFNKMVNDCQILPDVQRYGCVINMLGRAGRLEEAEKLALEIPSGISNIVIWRTLLGACSFHVDVEMEKRATKKMLEIQRGIWWGLCAFYPTFLPVLEGLEMLKVFGD